MSKEILPQHGCRWAKEKTDLQFSAVLVRECNRSGKETEMAGRGLPLMILIASPGRFAS